MSLVRRKTALNQLPNGVSDLFRTSNFVISRRAPNQRRHISIEQLDRDKDGRERVVVLGSGWAGFTVARRLDPKKYQTVVISPRSYFVFTPLLASTSVGTLEFRTALEPIRSRRAIVDFFQGWADSIDFANKELSIEEAVDDPKHAIAPTGSRWEEPSDEESKKQMASSKAKGKLFDMTYDKLVITVGCYSQTFGTPGVRENALFLKDVGDARKIRNRLLQCFETASLPTTSEQMKKNLLNFAIVGGGPTGIEFSAELHDLIMEDMAKLYPDLIKYSDITVYDVAPKVLSMFDEKLSKYAMTLFKREGISIRTSHHVESLRRGAPGSSGKDPEVADEGACWTLRIKEEGDIGVGMVVWSTGLMQNPLVEKQTDVTHSLPSSAVQHVGQSGSANSNWLLRLDSRTGSMITDDRLRIKVEAQSEAHDKPQAVMQDVYALGDCAIIEGTSYPATAQVASQKADWLAKRLNKGDLETRGFHFRNLGTMAYLGNWNAVLQSGSGPDFSGRTAFLIWRGAYLTKAVSWRNKILIPMYWFLNWVFGRDISRF